MIYFTTVLWDMLDSNDRKILGHFVQTCNLLMSRIITEDNLNEAQERLKDMAYLIEHAYGPEFIISNIHLAFHISNCCHDYDPIYTLTCQKYPGSSKKWHLNYNISSSNDH